eukprot:NODE_12336_length_1230_cov_10.654578.p3 GENE.NODE_12336_length_1230_cov_10.654578~~NODE_12336_length_1230_cov_10.654578.p3  ORF type:complete len:124 (+),score=33.85 NODE_12336_length_1230_cov_10.654578:507-878(+)
MRLIDENLRRLCACQGEAPAPGLATLQILVQCLRAPHLGCILPPLLGLPQISGGQPSSSAAGFGTRCSMLGSRESARRLSASCDDCASQPQRPANDEVLEDGEWTVVDYACTGNGATASLAAC